MKPILPNCGEGQSGAGLESTSSRDSNAMKILLVLSLRIRCIFSHCEQASLWGERDAELSSGLAAS